MDRRDHSPERCTELLSTWPQLYENRAYVDACDWCPECDICGKMAYVAFGAEDRREECIMIAKLLGKLSFTRHYGAYGVAWDAYAGDDRV